MKKQVKWGIFALIILVGLFTTLALTGVLKLQAVLPGDNVKIAVPHFGSFKCEVIQDKPGLEYTIPTTGLNINSKSVGFYTNKITNIKTSVDYSFWTSVIKDLRLRYTICDVNGNNCGTEQIIKYTAPGTRTAVLNSLNLKTQSLKINFEQLTILNYFIGKWTPYEGAKISYDGQAFALRYYTTTFDPAGYVVCSTSCDFSCPTQGVREKLIYTTQDTLDFYSTAPSLEYWESIDYDLNAQGGATVYNSATNKFCLAGAIYDAGTLKMDNGITYIYPNTATKQIKLCCPGAVISTTYEDKICQSDYTWKTITKDTKIPCISDLNCPGQGQVICQNKILSQGYSCENKICIKSTSSKVVTCCNANDCKDADQVCQANKCVGGATNPPINPLNNSNDKEQCEEKTDLFGLITYSEVTTTECNFGCQATKVISFGLLDTTSNKTSCDANYTLLMVILGSILIIIALIMFGKENKKKGKKDYKKIYITFGVIFGIIALILFWKQIAWIGLIIIILAILVALGWLIFKIFVSRGRKR